MNLNDAMAKLGPNSGGGSFGKNSPRTAHVCMNFFCINMAVFDDFKVDFKQFYRHVAEGDERYKEKMMYYICFKGAMGKLPTSDEKDELERALIAMLGKVKKEVVRRENALTTSKKIE